jgi:hypothetical protein
MSATNGLSFYQIQATNAPLSITYDFDALSPDDISVVVIATNDTRFTLTEGTHYSLDFETETITCLLSSWTGIEGVYSNSEIRIYRTTSVLPLIDFKAGAVLSEGDLDISYKQGLFAAQEAVEDAADTGAGLQSVPSSVIEDGAIVSSKLAPDAVTTDKIADNAVTAVKLEANTITAFQMASNSVDSSKLVNGAVTTTKLDNLAVETEKIANASVTQAKVDKADKTEMQSQSSTDGVVTPDVLKYSPFAPRAYGSVTYDTSAPVLSPGSYNVDSVSEPTTDKRTITFSVPLGDNDYVVVATMQAANAVGLNEIVTITNKSTTSFTMESTHNDENGLRIDFVVFGSTLNES